ncbi:MAG: hypothetical protein MJ174_00660 [Treponema sp.]|nr:hypothetical protein [Treponema sp.]
MKKLFFTGILILISTGILCLFIDFNSYHTNEKHLPYMDKGIVFSITTFDGVNETKPFVKCLGHTWLSLDNYSGHSIYLKDYEIKNNETLTFSVWAISAHKGVYFNLEPNFIKENGRYSGCQSLSINIDEEELSVIENYIDNNNKWTSIKNCSYWSIHLWNKIVDDDFKMKTQTIVYTPKKLLKSLKEFDCITTDKDFSHAKDIFFYNNGSREVLKLCSRK